MEPQATVVVATHDRRSRLAALLDALAAQQGAPPFEVVVVDDASSDGTFEMLAARAEAGADPFVLRPRRLGTNRGPATARNVGWRAAEAPVVCFTDDDCLPEPGWLAALLGATAGADIVQGRTVPDPDGEARQGPFSRTMTVPYEQGFYETCNIAYRREVLERAGGFDEGFRYPYGEDTDLAWRAKADGATTAFVAGAVVRHEVWASDWRAALRDMRRREGLVLLYRKHPHLRDHFGRRVFFREVHPPTVAAMGGLAVLAVRPHKAASWAVAAATGAWYAWTCRKVRHRPARKWEWAVVVPLAFVADAYEVAVMARASARYRMLLL